MSRLRLVGVGSVAATVAVAVGGTAFIIVQPTDGAVVTAVARELLIVSQPGSADGTVGSPSPSPGGSSARPRPVTGVSQAAMDHAVTIIEVGRQMNLPRRAYVVAIMTALQETALRNLANSTVPESLNYAHQGVYQNFDSVGLFQQRSSQGWGSVAELMDPATAARLFYQRLVKVPRWQAMSPGDAAQAVQRSAFPRAYDKQRARAERIVDAVL
ncbi:hypothetical protein [Planosporangium flavigriseum]|nr:hypothetical protein [Planosporangium flavigriseum]